MSTIAEFQRVADIRHNAAGEWEWTDRHPFSLDFRWVASCTPYAMGALQIGMAGSAQTTLIEAEYADFMERWLASRV